MPITPPTSQQICQIEQTAYELRQTVIEMLLEAKSGHTAGALGTAEIFAALYWHILNIDPANPTDQNRDRFILSNGHICPILYTALIHRGFAPKTLISTLRKLGSPLQGHPMLGPVAGVENTSGLLGQGLSLAAGLAMAAKLNNLSYRTYVMTGDGELDEGQIWEAAMYVPNFSRHQLGPLNNLTWIIDRNNIQIDGHTEQVMPLENLRDKLEAFNWHVVEIDGHDVGEIISACSLAHSISERPTAIIAHTIPGKGVDFMEYQVEWHGKPPAKDEAKKALKELASLKGKIICEYD